MSFREDDASGFGTPRGGASVRERARKFATLALGGGKVSPEAWRAAMTVAEKAILAAGKTVPLGMIAQTLRIAGLVIVDRARLDEVVEAARVYGFDKSWPTDTPKLSRLKGAIRELDMRRNDLSGVGVTLDEAIEVSERKERES